MINKRLKAISLFSGAMGLDLGIEKAGIEIKLCVELNKQAVATIRNNTDIPVIDRDITTIPTAELLEVSGLKLGDVDLVVGDYIRAKLLVLLELEEDWMILEET